MDEPANAATPTPRPPNLRRIIWLDAVLPFLAVIILERNGAPPLVAYGAASLFPIVSVLASWFGRRGIDVIGVGVLLGIASGLVLALVTADPRFALVRAAPAFALFGIACLVSLFTARPLMFFVARSSKVGGDAARIAAWNEQLGLPRFRRAMQLLTTVWGIGALIEASLAIAAAFLLPGQIALVAEPIIAFGIVAALLAWTRTLQRRAPAV